MGEIVMLEQIVAIAVRVYTHELARSIVKDPNLASAKDGGYHRLRGTIRDVQDNLAAELATYALRDDLKGACPVHSLVSRWYPSTENILTYMQSHRAYAELDRELLRDISVVAGDLGNFYDSIVKAITLCHVIEMGTSAGASILDQLLVAMSADEDLQDSVHHYKILALNDFEVGVADSEIVEQAQNSDSSITTLLDVFLSDVAIGEHDPSSLIPPADWKLIFDSLFDRLQYYDISFMQLVPRSVTELILRRFGFPSLVAKHLTRLLEERLSDFSTPADQTDRRPVDSIRPEVISRQEFGERLFDLFYKYGDVGACTRETLVSLCKAQSGKLKLKVRAGHYWPSRIAQLVAHKLHVDDRKLQLVNNDKDVEMDARIRTLKRGHDRKENPLMQQLVSAIEKLNVES